MSGPNGLLIKDCESIVLFLSMSKRQFKGMRDDAIILRAIKMLQLKHIIFIAKFIFSS